MQPTYLLPDGSGWSQRSQPFIYQTQPKPPILISTPGGLKVKFPDLPVGARFVTVWIAKEGDPYLGNFFKLTETFLKLP